MHGRINLEKIMWMKLKWMQIENLSISGEELINAISPLNPLKPIELGS